ncbi:aminotransferase class V-fold PLP-dependent enzyme [Xanthomarina spongicola]|uniref:dTDP-4-amino-4,6-dideoxygalactose transaminase n=1 Tax=Xanthomarina spongicola TaxID=570520 RepID=A0A316DS18_9FLAO|nr:aminotransferase class V-fold PLP-dependent enzyme [Xanthomarina spongicola]PWK19969.1 dTDP-4-amino-4,6-dideoxygalactose transaminase [Xanthomarina spongicola]
MAKNVSKLNTKIWLSSPHMSGHEKKFIKEAFKTNWIAPLGPNVNGFENDLENYLGNKVHVAALTTGTAAIHLALVLLNVKQGDEVICQTKTFAASVNPVTYLGAKPVFVDSERETWNICPELLEHTIKDRIKIGVKPKAIIVINLYGMPYKVKEINAISKKYNIPIVEDSAEALGSSYFDQKCGTFGDMSILSFNGNKIITTSGGGALVSKNKELKSKIIYLATQAKEPGLEYSHVTTGYNYRMSNILAGIGRGQMEVLDNYVELRRNNFKYYLKQLSAINEISFLNEPEGFYSNRWLTCIIFQTNKMRDDILKMLELNNIEARPSWKPMHLQPVFKNYPKYLNGVSDDLYKKALCLPSGSNLTKIELDRIIKLIKQYFE